MDSPGMMIQVIPLVVFQILFAGTMGAYMTWIMSGLFPIPGQSVYLIIRPAFSAVQWTVTNSRILTNSFRPENLFIQNVTVDGQPVRFDPFPRLTNSGTKIGSRMTFLQVDRQWK